MDGIMKVTNGNGVERAIDASASDPGRQLAIRATREWCNSHRNDANPDAIYKCTEYEKRRSTSKHQRMSGRKSEYRIRTIFHG